MDKHAIAAAYKRAIRAAGEPATLRRTAYGQPNVDAAVYAKALREPIRSSRDDTDNGVMSTARRYLILFEELSAWPLPIRKGDELVIGDLTLTVETIDAATRKYGGLQLAYEVEVYGA